MKVIGIDTRWDGTSWVVALGAEGKKPGPVWEKLRIFRLFDDFIKINFRDQLMARNLEKEIIEKGERGIIWIGSSHSYTHWRQHVLKMGKVVREYGRTRFILHQRHGDYMIRPLLSLERLSYEEPQGQVSYGIINHLKLTFIADKPPPPRIALRTYSAPPSCP